MNTTPSMPVNSLPLRMATLHAGRFTAEFLAYLLDNGHVYAAFEAEALQIARRGITHYSARTIVEVLRHTSSLTETSGTWKLNDRYTPFLARLFVLLHPAHAGLFEFRVAKSVRAGAAPLAYSAGFPYMAC